MLPSKDIQFSSSVLVQIQSHLHNYQIPIFKINMKTCTIFATFLGLALAAPQGRGINPTEVILVKDTPSDNIGLDGYKFSYELSDGSKREESAQIETQGVEDAVLRVRGSFSWVNPEDGQIYTVTYTADENGFQPQGAHLPTV